MLGSRFPIAGKRFPIIGNAFPVVGNTCPECGHSPPKAGQRAFGLDSCSRSSQVWYQKPHRLWSD
jgi:hypothetical protein